MRTRVFQIFGSGVSMALLLGAADASAQTCTSSTIRNALNSKGSFVFNQEGCTNTRISIPSPIEVGANKTIDGSGKMVLVWSGAQKCNEKPTSNTIFTVRGSNSTLRNFTIDWSPEGIHLIGNNNVVDGVKYNKICEDGLTNYGRNNVIRNSLFQNAPDKCIQTNGGSATFENNTFRNCPRAIGACSDKADPGNHPMANCRVASFNTVRRNTVEGCSGGYGFRAAGKKSKNAAGWLKAYDNSFRNCRWALQSEEDGIVYARGNRFNGGGAFRTLAKGRIYDCKNDMRGGSYSSGPAPIKSCTWPE